MKKRIRFFKGFLCVVFLFLVMTGCASLGFNSVTITTPGNVSSVIAGGTLGLRASGRDIVWTISSTSDGTGQVSNGTFINQNGLLSVAFNEHNQFIYVFARSTHNDLSDFKQIRIVTVDTVNITPVDSTVVLGRTLQFRASVTGTNNPDNAVTWSVSSSAAAGVGPVASGTAIDLNGLLRVSSNETRMHLFVT
ncbi:MAG: Ig-like domain-containing protein, partial [Treponema sp.]|nr:Ig-like domain-containing protein [Treponema sp.]